jgi:hypothetical protein
MTAPQAGADGRGVVEDSDRVVGAGDGREHREALPGDDLAETVGDGAVSEPRADVTDRAVEIDEQAPGLVEDVNEGLRVRGAGCHAGCS